MPDDYYWGRGADGTGANTLGKILMKVRFLLRDCAGGPSVSEILDRIVQELLDRHVGGVPFFDHLDAAWRLPRGWPVVQHLLARAAVQPHPSNPAPFEKTFPGATAVSTGRFGMFLNNAFGVDLILATGGLRTTAPMDDLWYVRQKLERGQGRDFILLDDSFYSGQTRNLIREELERQGGRLVHTYVVYDGNRERDPDVSALYRYYDQFAPSQGQANPNVRVGVKQPS